MKLTLIAALIMMSMCLCSCGLGSDATEGEGLGRGTPVDNPIATEGSISVVCDVELNLTPKSGIRVDWMDRERGWAVTVVGNEFTLTRRSICGDECSLTEEIVLASTDGECPSVVSVRSVLREAMTSQGPMEFVTSATKGSLDIQDWDMESGVLSGRLSTEVEFVFYAMVEKSSRP